MVCGCYSIYYLFQKLSGSHKALVEMQDDVSELLRSATREYKQTKVRPSVNLFGETPHYRAALLTHTPPTDHRLSCVIVVVVMTERPDEWDPVTDLERSLNAPVHIKLC